MFPGKFCSYRGSALCSAPVDGHRFFFCFGDDIGGRLEDITRLRDLVRRYSYSCHRRARSVWTAAQLPRSPRCSGGCSRHWHRDLDSAACLCSIKTYFRLYERATRIRFWSRKKEYALPSQSRVMKGVMHYTLTLSVARRPRMHGKWHAFNVPALCSRKARHYLSLHSCFGTCYEELSNIVGGVECAAFELSSS